MSARDEHRARHRAADGQRAGHDALRHRRQRRLPPGAHRQVLAACRTARSRRRRSRRTGCSTRDPTTNAQLDSQVQYAMEMTTVDGTGTSAAVGLGSRQIIAKTGTTTSYHSGFFIGAIPQYSLVVGMFTKSQDVNSSESLRLLDRRRLRWLLASQDLEHVRPGGVRQPAAADLPEPDVHRRGVEPGRQDRPATDHLLHGGRQEAQAAGQNLPRPRPRRRAAPSTSRPGRTTCCTTCLFDQSNGQFDNCCAVE